MLTTIASYRMIVDDLPRALDTTARKPLVARETAYYMANIGRVASIDDFISNDRLFSYAMKAFGLAEMIYAKAFMRKVLTEGVDDPQSFANRLADLRYREFVETFNFTRYGTATTSFGRTQQGVVDRHVRQMLEEESGRQNEGVRLALYFQRRAPGLSSVYEILADRALLRVVQTALQLPPIMAGADIDWQAASIARRLDISDLKKPANLQNFIDRFLSLWEMAVPNTHWQNPAPLLIGQRVEVGVGADLLISLQNLNLRRL